MGGEDGAGLDCEAACGRLADCSVGDECPGVSAAERNLVASECAPQCEGNPVLLHVLNGPHGRCEPAGDAGPLQPCQSAADCAGGAICGGGAVGDICYAVGLCISR